MRWRSAILPFLWFALADDVGARELFVLVIVEVPLQMQTLKERILGFEVFGGEDFAFVLLRFAFFGVGVEG